MDLGSKLEELNLTRDEMNRFGAALKDERFRELLSEYAAEISDPGNRRRYEEEIAQLERDRGMSMQFIHPEAHHVLKTRSARGKVFINICSNPRIDEPSCEAARDRGGKPGHTWRLPYSLTPGRADRDAAGSACEVYDVVFHPDALQMAAASARFMRLIHSTAVGAIEDSLQVRLDRNRLKRLRMSYKGAAQPAVIRRPIPGHDQRSRSAGEDMLAFPYPDEKPTEPEPTASPPENTRPKPPITPHYTLKYRSVVDLQDYRCSRDSGPGARPRQIVLVVDVPLLGSAQDADLRVTERRLVLEAPEPAYRLDLPLAYPVDEERGDAKFNKERKQLTITLPVRPAENPEIQRTGCEETKSDGNEEADQKPKEGLDPDHKEDLDHTEGGLDPDHKEGGLDPDHKEDDLDPDHTEGGLDHTEEDLDSDHTEEGLDLDHKEDLEPDHTEDHLNPDHTEQDLDPDHTADLDPDHTEDLDLDHTADLDPDHTADLDPDHTEDLDPDHTADLDPDHTADLDPDHTADLDPDHTGSEWSQGSRGHLPSEPQIIDLTSEPDTHEMSNGPTENRTEPEPDQPEDDIIERAVDSSSDTADANTLTHTGTPTHLIRTEEAVLTETGHMTSAAFCFQNTLWFDLD